MRDRVDMLVGVQGRYVGKGLGSVCWWGFRCWGRCGQEDVIRTDHMSCVCMSAGPMW